MSDNKSIIMNINLRTSLLESLNWDEEQLFRLEAYLSSLSNDFILLHPKQVVNNIAKHFTVEASKIIENFFKDELDRIITKKGKHDENWS